MLGATPLLGRTIDPSDARAKGSNPVVVVSERYWQQSMSSDPGVLDRTISINGNPYRVVGVMPASFHGIKQDLEPPALWVPDTMQQQIFIGPDMLAPRSFYFLQMFARRKASAMDKAGLQKAQLWLDQQVRAYIRAGEGAVVASDRQKEIERATVSLVPAAQGVSGVGQQFGGSLLILMVVVALVLLIACANLANFLVARAVTRQREIRYPAGAWLESQPHRPAKPDGSHAAFARRRRAGTGGSLCCDARADCLCRTRSVEHRPQSRSTSPCCCSLFAFRS